MESNQYGVHEVTDLRELINFKGTCLAQDKTRLKTVENSELKALVEQSMKLGQTSVTQMKDILSKAMTQMNQ
ncbi:hypothetical protein [Halalkalibacter urbisdiaboli]|uniref:hypothetical protein n=1 Tax=Halalkalibacter urbisdiaboli TaxID=1960589 RepID=UPI000B434DF5|nr:hypothetical protein [Halalkalibacter urbisdiaboli]